ncbi:MAG: HAD family hydrolase [Candidatus Kapaibacteriales bacterium]
MEKRLVLWDIDGTILSVNDETSKGTFVDVFNGLFDVCISISDLPNFSGNTDLGILKEITSNKGIDFSEVIHRKNEIWSHMLDFYQPKFTLENVKLLSGISELIGHIHNDNNLVSGLVTGNNRDCAYAKLKTHSLDSYFEEGAFGSDHYDRNILPRIALDRHLEIYPGVKFRYEDTLVIGDSPKDIECAKANNMISVAVATGNYSKEELVDYSPDLIFDDLSNLEDCMVKLGLN